MGNGTPRGDRGRPLQMMDAGSTGLGFKTHGHPIMIWLRLSIPFRGALTRLLTSGLRALWKDYIAGSNCPVSWAKMRETAGFGLVKF
jgi:hypothetical protein